MPPQVKEEINSFIAFNRGMKEAHDAEKKKAQEMDVIMLREYEAKLEQQERERQAHLKKISERQARQYAMADRVHQSLQELASADEEKAKREQEALERRQMDEETRRKEKKKEEQRKVKEVVARQIEEKEEAKRKAQEEAARLKEEVQFSCICTMGTHTQMHLHLKWQLPPAPELMAICACTSAYA